MKPSPTGKIVKHVFDPSEPISQETIDHFKALKGRPIDFSDIPPQTIDDAWYQPGPLLAVENKQQVTLRLDKDVLDFFRGTGKRYQTRINQVLREYMQAHTPAIPKR